MVSDHAILRRFDALIALLKYVNQNSPIDYSPYIALTQLHIPMLNEYQWIECVVESLVVFLSLIYINQ